MGDLDRNHKGNVSDYIYQVSREFPDNYAVLHPEKVTYKEFQRNIDIITNGLTNLGIKKGHQILFLVKPGEIMFSLVFAVLRIGAIPVMIDPGMGAKAMSKALEKIRIEVFIGEPKAHLLRVLFPALFKSVFCYLSTSKTMMLPSKNLGSVLANDWKPSKSAIALPSDNAAIFFTSGSTGPAKAVLYKNSMLHAQIKILRDHFGYEEGEIDCCTFPLTSLLVMCLGLTIVFADMNMTKPASLNPEKLINNINENGCTHLFCSPMVLKKLSAYGIENKISLPSLKRIMSAGAIVPFGILNEIRYLLSDEAEIHTPYGSTEALPVSDITHKQLFHVYDSNKENNDGICIGYPVPGAKVKIIEITNDEIDDIADVNEVDSPNVGEIIVLGPQVTQDYLGQKNPKLSKIRENESSYWHRMGDLGKIDSEGRIWYCGRKSQSVVTENEILFTTKTEMIFNKHKLINRTALIGIKIENKTYYRPSICIEPVRNLSRKEKKQVVRELTLIATEHNLGINTFYFYNTFPVDPRHNAKINREKLTQWSQKRKFW